MATTTRAEEDRIRQEQGERFLKQLQEMFQQTRADMAQQFMPRVETQARMDHQDEMIERLTSALEKLTTNEANFHESVPRTYADRAEMKAVEAELRIEIEKIKTARESDMQRGFGSRLEDIQGRYSGDIAGERGWRGAQQEHSTQSFDRLWIGMLALIGLVSPIVSIIITLTLRR